jgi:predicted dehydrogenase
VETFAPCDQYSLEGDAFALAIRGEAPLQYGVEDAVQNMRIIDALFASQRSGRWEAL